MRDESCSTAGIFWAEAKIMDVSAWLILSKRHFTVRISLYTTRTYTNSKGSRLITRYVKINTGTNQLNPCLKYRTRQQSRDGIVARKDQPAASLVIPRQLQLNEGRGGLTHGIPTPDSYGSERTTA